MKRRKPTARRFAALGICALSALSAFCASSASAFDPSSPGPVATPSEWTATDPDSSKTLDGGVFELTGTRTSSEWRSGPVKFEPRRLYRVRFKASTVKEGSGDCVPVGTPFAHYDFNGFPLGETPESEYGFTFFVPDGVETTNLRLAQWESRRTYRFADVEIAPVRPVYRLIAAATDAKSQKSPKNADYLELGGGETLKNGRYSFRAFTTFEPTNFDRPLFSATSSFNTTRWTIGGSADVVYRFALETTRLNAGTTQKTGEIIGKIGKTRKIPFESGTVTARIGHWVGGKIVVEASRDAENWAVLGELTGVGLGEFSLDPLFNGDAVGAKKADSLDEIFVRLRGADGDDGSYCNAQIYEFAANLTTNAKAAAKFNGEGRTMFAELADETNADAPDWKLWGETDRGWIARDGERFVEADGDSALFSRVESTAERTENDERFPTEERFVAKFKRPASFGVFTYPYFNQDFTRAVSGLKGKKGDAVISWCEADQRVPRDPKRVEIQAAEVAKIAAAKNDFESFQIVLQAGENGLNGVEGELFGDLTNENGAKIAAENVDLRYAYYHFVDHPTDRICAAGYYPDALIPLEQGADGRGAPLQVEPGQNLPIWATVRIPADAAPGTYRGAVRLRSGKALDVRVPFELVVWDFALPAKNQALETAYGLSAGTVWRYHNCTEEADRRAVWEKYLKMFGDYRISMYDPAPLDGISVKWLTDESPARCEIDFTRFDAEMKRVFEKYNFTNFRLPFQGLGGGTYESRSPGNINGFAADAPEYKAAMADYGRKMQEHLREIGLLDAAYVYWFDEPEPKDYEFCANGFAILKKYAPEISRMLTEEPSDEFGKILDEKDADIDVWCPLSSMYSNEAAAPELAKGNRFWQYVCTGPKEPYCTEFLDHPAIELRVWHWQMFERGVVGSLIWTTNWWTSDLAFPDKPQNPYLDPESYMSGYNFPVGTISRWGNGDGRFIYPPLTAATPGRNDGKPIFDEPNASIRWEILREAVQDYEMLAELKRLAETRDLTPEQRKKVEEIFDFSPITTDMTTFSVEPSRIYEKRRAVAEAIVELNAEK